MVDSTQGTQAVLSTNDSHWWGGATGAAKTLHETVITAALTLHLLTSIACKMVHNGAKLAMWPTTSSAAACAHLAEDQSVLWFQYDTSRLTQHV